MTQLQFLNKFSLLKALVERNRIIYHTKTVDSINIDDFYTESSLWMEHAQIDPAKTLEENLQIFLQLREMPVMDKDCQIIDRAQAEKILTNDLHKDLPYGNEVMPENFARSMANYFLDLFHEGQPKYISLVQPEETEITYPDGTISYPQPRGFSLIQNTLEDGVIAIDERRIGILWIGEED